MSRMILRIVLCTVVILFVHTVVTGCGFAASLPDTVTVTLPDGSTAEVDQGAGVPSLANTTWDFFNTGQAGQNLAFVRIHFDENGALSSFENNTIAQEIFGSTIRFDGQRHDTTQKGIAYEASTFGAETSDGSGFAFEGRMFAFVAGIKAGEASASAQGVFDAADPNLMTGTFTFPTEVTLINIPEANISDSFAFLARRVQ
ncbi:MAG: hypothetical protein D6788_00010 [Planctomycetota bacterium]|nr:MAG: hypothetical protein D6788_00010 [Planctomycetota bacterium]